MKKEKPKHIFFKIPVDIYKRDIAFSFGLDYEEYEKKLKKLLPDTAHYEIKESYCCGLGRTYRFTTKQIVVSMPNLPFTNQEFGTLAHEIFHAVTMLLANCGLRLSDKSDEAYAYLISFVTEHLYSKIGKHV